MRKQVRQDVTDVGSRERASLFCDSSLLASLSTSQTPARSLKEGANASMEPETVSGSKSVPTSPDFWLVSGALAP